VAPRVPTFIRAYDDLLGGGVPPGHVVLLSGGAGTMKSSLAYSILHENTRRGGAGLYVTVEQDAHSLLAQLRSMGFPVEATAKALPPAASMRAAVSSISARLRAVKATAAPASANPMAIARPMPRPLPVTMATLPVRSSAIFSPYMLEPI